MSEARKPSSEPISAAFARHYTETFASYGATPRGVNWGASTDPELRNGKFLELIETDWKGVETPKLLDVGCGYGELLSYAKHRGIAIDYTGIDLVPEMVEHARRAHPDARFAVRDILDMPETEKFDYAICAGILTNKLDASISEMDEFTKHLLRKMFSLCRRGISFNMMSTYVDFIASTGYHKSPVEMVAFCAGELSPRLRMDHSYAAFEYILSVYRAEPRTRRAG